MDGQFMTPSVYTEILATADSIYWRILGRHGLLEDDPADVEQPAG